MRPHRWQPSRLPVPGILQARTLEWAAISFSTAWKWKVKVKSLSRVRFLATPWTVAYQAPPSMGSSRQECWSGVPLPPPVWGTDVSSLLSGSSRAPTAVSQPQSPGRRAFGAQVWTLWILGSCKPGEMQASVKHFRCKFFSLLTEINSDDTRKLIQLLFPRKPFLVHQEQKKGFSCRLVLVSVLDLSSL